MSKNTSKYRINQLKQEILQLDKKLSSSTQQQLKPLCENNHQRDLEVNDLKCSLQDTILNKKQKQREKCEALRQNLLQERKRARKALQVLQKQKAELQQPNSFKANEYNDQELVNKIYYIQVQKQQAMDEKNSLVQEASQFQMQQEDYKSWLNRRAECLLQQDQAQLRLNMLYQQHPDLKQQLKDTESLFNILQEKQSLIDKIKRQQEQIELLSYPIWQSSIDQQELQLNQCLKKYCLSTISDQIEQSLSQDEQDIDRMILIEQFDIIKDIKCDQLQNYQNQETQQNDYSFTSVDDTSRNWLTSGAERMYSYNMSAIESWMNEVKVALKNNFQLQVNQIKDESILQSILISCRQQMPIEVFQEFERRLKEFVNTLKGFYQQDNIVKEQLIRNVKQMKKKLIDLIVNEKQASRRQQSSYEQIEQRQGRQLIISIEKCNNAILKPFKWVKLPKCDAQTQMIRLENISSTINKLEFNEKVIKKQLDNSNLVTINTIQSKIGKKMQLIEDLEAQLRLLQQKYRQKASQYENQLQVIQQESVEQKNHQKSNTVPKYNFTMSLFQDKNTISIKQFYENISPLLQGAEFYKKFAQRSSLKQKAFDPLGKFQPEQCGYGLRTLKLSRNLLKIEINQLYKTDVERGILVEEVIAPIIPQVTIDVLKIQKKVRGSCQLGIDEDKYEELKMKGMLDSNSDAFKQRALKCNYYAFSIALQVGGRIELIAKSYMNFKRWVNGINSLVKYKKSLDKLSNRLQCE